MFSAEILSTLLVLLLWSIITRESSLFLLSLGLLVATGLSVLWERYCLVRVEYRRRFSRRAAAFGETVELETEVVNRKLLPLSWLEVDDEIPQTLRPLHGRVSICHKPGRAYLSWLLAMRPYERVRRRYSFPCETRGEHLFGAVRLRSGDLFGFSTREAVIPGEDSLVVYPRVVPLAHLGLPARLPLGELRAQSWLFQDVSRTAGAREYRPGDGLRRIHWPATARTQQLQTRVYEATTSHRLALFLNVATNEEEWYSYDYDPDVLEMSITTAASIANWALDQGYQTGLYTNGLHRLSSHRVVVRPARDPYQLERILMALGRLQTVSVERLEELLRGEARSLVLGTTVVVVTPALLGKATAEVLALRARGHGVALVLTGRKAEGPQLRGVPSWRTGAPESWREMETLVAAGGGNGHG